MIILNSTITYVPAQGNEPMSEVRLALSLVNALFQLPDVQAALDSGACIDKRLTLSSVTQNFQIALAKHSSTF